MKSYTDLEQSKKLAEILSLKSADMCYIKDKPNIGFLQEEYKEFGDTILQDYYPCWSLATLFDVLPEYINFDGHIWKFYNDHYGMYYMNADTYDTDTFSTNSENLVDAAFEMIIKLHEQNLI